MRKKQYCEQLPIYDKCSIRLDRCSLDNYDYLSEVISKSDTIFFENSDQKTPNIKYHEDPSVGIKVEYSNFALKSPDYLIDDCNQRVDVMDNTDTAFSYSHFHPYIEICCAISGEGKYFAGDKCFDMRAGDILIFNSYVPHAWQITQTNVLQVDVLYYQPDVLVDFDGSNPSLETAVTLGGKSVIFISQASETANRMRTAIRRIAKELTERDINYEACAKANLTDFLILLHREFIYTKVANQDGNFLKSYVNRAIEYIGEHIEEKITLDDVAKHVHLTNAYFSHIFSQNVGNTFSAYLKKTRVKKSAELLLTTDLPIIEIAELCGFTNLSNYYRAFNKIYNVSPNKFRNRTKD